MIQNLNELKSFKYCGHSTLMGKAKRDWQDTSDQQAIDTFSFDIRWRYALDVSGEEDLGH